MAYGLIASGSCHSCLAIRYPQWNYHSPYYMLTIFVFDGIHVSFLVILLFLSYPSVHIVPYLVAFSAPLDLWFVSESWMMWVHLHKKNITYYIVSLMLFGN
jgi:hypothetical protein